MSRLDLLQKASASVALVLLVSHTATAAPQDLRARARAATDPTEIVQLARELRRAGLVTEALSLVQKGFAKARGDGPVSALRLELARTYLDQRLPKRATNECLQTHKMSPFIEHLCTAEVQLYMRRGSVALPEAEQALALEPGDYDATVAKGRALSQYGRPAEAEATLRQAIGLSSSRPEARRYLAELKLSENDAPAALAALKEARGVAPDDPDTLVMIGETLPENAEAREALERAVTVRPTFARAKARLGRVLLTLGELDRAEQVLSEAVAQEPRQADWHGTLGEVFIAKKKPDAALKAAHTALGIVGNHGPAKLVEAQALSQKGDIDLAISAYEAAYGFLKSDPRALIAAARACADAGRLTTAKAFADRATEDFPRSAEAWEALGDVAAASKDRPLAKKSYEKAAASDGGNKERLRGKLATLK